MGTAMARCVCMIFRRKSAVRQLFVNKQLENFQSRKVRPWHSDVKLPATTNEDLVITLPTTLSKCRFHHKAAGRSEAAHENNKDN
jgi:hypothetical protein